MTLEEWIQYGRRDQVYSSKAKVRGWLREARGHVPVIDRVSNPDFDIDCRRSVARVNFHECQQEKGGSEKLKGQEF